MTTIVDLTELEASQAPSVLIAHDLDVREAGSGSAFEGFSDVAAVNLVVSASKITGPSNPSLTVLVEQSADGLSWSTAATFEFGDESSTKTTLVSSPLDQLRVSWSIAGRRARYAIISVLAVPAIIQTPAAPGGGSSTSVTISDIDPGALGAGQLWLQTDPLGLAANLQLWVRDAGDAKWVPAGAADGLTGRAVSLQAFASGAAQAELGLTEGQVVLTLLNANTFGDYGRVRMIPGTGRFEVFDSTTGALKAKVELTDDGGVGLVNTLLGFYSATPVAQPGVPVTLGDVIAGLQALGLFAT